MGGANKILFLLLLLFCSKISSSSRSRTNIFDPHTRRGNLAAIARGTEDQDRGRNSNKHDIPHLPTTSWDDHVILHRCGSDQQQPSRGGWHMGDRHLARGEIYKLSILVLGIATLSYLAYEHRVVLGGFFDKKKIQATVLDVLRRIENEGERGVLIYIVGMALWELFGLSTIPVETASGMAFGLGKGIFASSCGKVLGASMAFFAGRYFLRDWAHEKLRDNHVMQLIDGTSEANPLRVSFFLKYSCFPEFVKNFGSAILDPIRYWMFLSATIVHGCSFTVLWNWLGVDSARRLSDESLPVDYRLRAALAIGASVGIVVSPLLMAWWVQDMRKQNKKMR